MIKIHHRSKLGDGSDYYSKTTFNNLKRYDFYWINNYRNYYVLFKIWNYVVGKKHE